MADPQFNFLMIWAYCAFISFAYSIDKFIKHRKVCRCCSTHGEFKAKVAAIFLSCSFFSVIAGILIELIIRNFF